MNVNNLLEGASPYQALQDQSAKLAGKWEKSGLLEGIQSSTEANNMAMLLENQAKQLVVESSLTGGGAASVSGGGVQGPLRSNNASTAGTGTSQGTRKTTFTTTGINP